MSKKLQKKSNGHSNWVQLDAAEFFRKSLGKISDNF